VATKLVRCSGLILGMALACLLAFGAGGAAARTSHATLKRGAHGAAVARLQRKLHVTADGEFGPGTVRALKRYQRRHHLRATGAADARTLRALGLATDSRSVSGGRTYEETPTRSTKLPAVLRRIADCESGGDPTAVSKSGRYRGKYQFDRATWRSLGGHGDPAEASEALQDRLALKLYHRRGTAPWGRCASS
jgi:soluble lytic murein transglycosylase-like protein